LTSEYENLIREKEGLKTTQRDLRNEMRALKEQCTRQETSQTLLEQEKEKLKAESRSLGNLRAEHSSLKVIIIIVIIIIVMSVIPSGT
jgi:hypothetical protein